MFVGFLEIVKLNSSRILQSSLQSLKKDEEFFKKLNVLLEYSKAYSILVLCCGCCIASLTV